MINYWGLELDDFPIWLIGEFIRFQLGIWINYPIGTFIEKMPNFDLKVIISCSFFQKFIQFGDYFERIRSFFGKFSNFEITEGLMFQLG